MPVDDPAVGAPILQFISVKLPDEFVVSLEKEINDILGFVTQRVHGMSETADDNGVETATESPLLTEVARLIAAFEHETLYEPNAGRDPVFVIVMELLVELDVTVA